MATILVVFETMVGLVSFLIIMLAAFILGAVWMSKRINKKVEEELKDFTKFIQY